MNSLQIRFRSVLASPTFFWVIVGLFIVNALWIAGSATYPLLFDEHYHVGLIEIYSRGLSPFITTQPPEAALYGDITRVPSYLYHYLLSFPYRLAALFSSELAVQVVLLRIINIMFAVVGLVLFRKLLLEAKLSPRIVNSALAVFTLIPIVPFVAAHVNYDNLLLVFVPLLLLLSLRFCTQPNKRLLYGVLFLITAALAALVKFTALPMILACLLFVVIQLVAQKKSKRAISSLRKQLKALGVTTIIVLSAGLALGGGLFVERYGLNAVRHASISPECDDIQPRGVCAEFGPWARNERLKAQKNPDAQLQNPLQFTLFNWLPHIMGDMYVVATYSEPRPLQLHTFSDKLQAAAGSPVLMIAGWVVFVAGLGALLIRVRDIFKNKLLTLLLIVIAVYTSALLLRNISDYYLLGERTATQGRYFVPLLIPLLVLMVVALNSVVKKTNFKLAILACVATLFLFGGGALSFVRYSQPSWYWQNETVININTASQNVLKLYLK